MTGPCGRCGADDWRTERAGLGAASLRWLQQGGHWRPAEAFCRRCGLRAPSGGVLYWTGPRHPATVPVRVVRGVVRALHGERTAEPAPWLYLASLAGGGAAGAAAAVITRSGRRALGSAVGAGCGAATCWTVFAGTARGPQLLPALVDAVLQEVAPRRAARRRGEREEALARSVAFPVYGLPPEWNGRRSLAGWSARGREPVVTALSLRHGDPAPGPELLVETEGDLRRPAPGEPEAQRSAGPEGQTHPPAADDALDERPGAARARGGRVPAPGDADRAPAPPEERTLLVDGQPVGFSVTPDGAGWTASAEVGGVRVRLRARSFPVEDVALVRVADLDAYLGSGR